MNISSFSNALTFPATNVKINDLQKNKILTEIINSIKENSIQIKNIATIDSQYSNQNINIDELLNIVKDSMQLSPSNNNQKNIIFSYYGNPYITLNLCLTAILNNIKIIILLEDEMIGVNSILIKIFTEVLKNYKIINLIFFCNLVSAENVVAYLNSPTIKRITTIDKIICIGNINKYENFRRFEFETIEYYGFETLEIFCDSQELKSLQADIYNYAYENNFEIEVFSDSNIKDAVNSINNFGSHYCSILLSTSEESKTYFKENIKSENIFINQNPFKNLKFKLPEKYLQ